MICCLRPQTAFCVAANQSYDTFEKMDINTIFGLSTIEIMRESIKINYRLTGQMRIVAILKMNSE